MDIIKSLNLNKLINNAELLAVKPAGSMLRKIDHANSDFDMVCLVRENRHELLTSKLINKQVINTVNGINIDVRVIDLRSFYKQIMNQSPEYHDFYYSEDAIDNALISDAKGELKKIIKTDYGTLDDRLNKQLACQDYVSRVFESSLAD